jgi:choline dehydrogenase
MGERALPDRPTLIIVGSGAAGLTLAHRLADVADITVLEAGADAGSPPPRWLLDDLVFGEGLDWGYTDADTSLPLPRGKITGGSTSVNAAAALRGQPWCFDEWGVDGWSWNELRHAFAELESDRQFGHAPHHGDAGPLPITRLPFGPIDDDFAQWAQRHGHAWVEDQNAPGALGVGHWPTNMVENGRRWGAHAALLPGLRDRVTVRSATEVARLILDDGHCRGVEVVGPNGPEALFADHVILAAGSFNSPLLLLRSGVGPSEVLAQAGIPLVHELAGVGGNLQDHPWSVIQLRATDHTAPGQRPVNGVLLRYEIDSDDHLEVHLYPHQARPYLPDADPADVILGLGLMRATSRGSVRLAADGTAEIRLNQLATEQDRRAWNALLADAAAYIDDAVARGVFEAPDDRWWEAGDLDAADLDPAAGSVVRAHLDSYGHAVGTCRLGTASDPLAVVNEQLAVIGLSGLSIADASVIPVSPRANTMLATMAVAWHGAAVIAERLGLPLAAALALAPSSSTTPSTPHRSDAA